MSFTITLPGFFQPGHYTSFYLLAVATYQGLLLLEGYRRGFALRPWLLMQAATLLAFVIGCKLIVLPMAAWPELWNGAALAAEPVRSALGGVAASGAVLLALRRWLGLPWAAFDAFVLPLAIGLMVQCLGCLSAGCCWGELAGHGPGLSFGPGTVPYAMQVAQGLLPAGAAHALPVVPTQVYALLVCGAIAGLSVAARRQAWAGGTRYLLATGVLLLTWALLSQWRDPASQTLGAIPLVLAGVRLLTLQWGLLAAGLTHLGGAVWLLRRPHLVTSGLAEPARPARQLVGAVALLSLTAFVAPHALTGAEFRVLQVALAAVLLAEVAAWWPAAQASFAWKPQLSLTTALALLLLMSQAPAPQALPEPERSIDFAVGAVSGGFDQDEYFGPTTGSSGCGGGGTYNIPASRDGYAHRYQAAGGQISVQIKPEGRGRYGTIGLGIWAGTDEVRFARQALNGPLSIPAAAPRQTIDLMDINPFIEGWDGPESGSSGFGGGYHAGLHLGNLVYGSVKRGDSLLTATYTIMPDVMVWAGNRQWLYGQADAGYGAASIGNYYYRIGLGSGLGSYRGGTLLAGVAFAALGSPTTPDAGTTSSANQQPTTLGFVAANIRLAGSGFSLEPTAATDFARHNQLSLRLHYRLPIK